MTVLLRLEEQQHIISEFKRIMGIFCLLTSKWKSKLTVRSLH